jgi:hypothetical protein
VDECAVTHERVEEKNVKIFVISQNFAGIHSLAVPGIRIRKDG